VRLPAYALGEPLPLQLRFGGADVAGDAAQVWEGRYSGVWHMADSLSGIDGDEIKNSARPLEPGLTAGQMQPEQRVAGVVGPGLRFDGQDDVVTVDAEFVGQLDSYALTFWVLFDGPADTPGDYFQRLNGDYFYPRCWRIAGGPVFCQYIVNDAVTSLGSGLDQAVGQRLHLAMVRDAAAATTRLYIDGELVRENIDPAGATLPTEGYPFELGRGELGTLPGVLDEVRVSEAPLSEAWVRADYRTQLQPDLALASVGAIEAAPCG
jgi:Concanavalin A-like lectin/glucanases superfamily